MCGGGGGGGGGGIVLYRSPSPVFPNCSFRTYGSYIPIIPRASAEAPTTNMELYYSL